LYQSRSEDFFLNADAMSLDEVSALESWFVVENQQRKGPFSALVLRKMLIAGEISLDAVVIREGSTIRRKIVDVSEVFVVSEKNVSEDFVTAVTKESASDIDEDSTRVALVESSEATLELDKSSAGSTKVASDYISVEEQKSSPESVSIKIEIERPVPQGRVQEKTSKVGKSSSPVRDLNIPPTSLVFESPATISEEQLQRSNNRLETEPEEPREEFSGKADAALGMDTHWLKNEVLSREKPKILDWRERLEANDKPENQTQGMGLIVKPSIPVKNTIPVVVQKQQQEKSSGLKIKKQGDETQLLKTEQNDVVVLKTSDSVEKHMSRSKQDKVEPVLEVFESKLREKEKREPRRVLENDKKKELRLPKAGGSLREEKAVCKADVKRQHSPDKRAPSRKSVSFQSRDFWIIGFFSFVVVLIFVIIALQKAGRTETEREVVELQQPSQDAREAPRVPMLDPAATGEWGTDGEVPSGQGVEKKLESKRESDSRRADKPDPPRVRSQKVLQKSLQKSSRHKPAVPIKKVGQQVSFSGVQVSGAPSQCAPCRISARLSDGKRVLLVSPNAHLWISAGAHGNVLVSIKGSVVKIADTEPWILLQAVSMH
jgi:hypothetical protein